MAIYHLSASIIGRSDGRSAVAASAYRAGADMTDPDTGTRHDYTRKRGVRATFMELPEGAPDWAADRPTLWNAVHAKETRKNSRLSREIRVALPAELDAEVAAFRSRSLAHTSFPYLFVDATYLKARVDGRVVSRAVVIATGVTADGGREVLGPARDVEAAGALSELAGAHEPLGGRLAGRAEVLLVGGLERALVRGAQHVLGVDLLVLAVEDRVLDGAVEELVGVAAEELVERVVARDVDGEPAAAAAGATPLLSQ